MLGTVQKRPGGIKLYKETVYDAGTGSGHCTLASRPQGTKLDGV